METDFFGAVLLLDLLTADAGLLLDVDLLAAATGPEDEEDSSFFDFLGLEAALLLLCI